MALISIYVDDNEFDRVLDAVASYHQWQGETASGTKQEFLNLIVRGFLQQSVKAFDISEARRLAEEAANALPSVPLEDADTFQPYYYFMICTAASRDQYNYMASNLMPGLSFSIPFSNDITGGTITHYGLEGAFTEFQRQQLATLEATGATGNRGIISLFYARCDRDKIMTYSNIPELSYSGSLDLDGMANFLGLVRV